MSNSVSILLRRTKIGTLLLPQKQILLAASKSAVPTGFEHCPHHSVLIHVTSLLPILMPIHLDTKVSFKLIVQTKST